MKFAAASALESHIAQGLFRITDDAGNTLGSGYALDCGLLTCAHVIGARRPDQLHAVSGTTITRIVDLVVSWKLDVALLLLDREHEGLAVSESRPDALIVGGYPSQPGLSGPLLARTTIDGLTAITYEANGTKYELEQVWALPGGLILPGMSGGPAIDVASGAVVGMVVADFVLPAGKIGLSGFVQPHQRLADDPQIGPLFAQSMQARPRFGATPNALGALIWCRAATKAELARMHDECRYDPEAVVPREALTAQVARFLESDDRALAIIDRSGLGKSTALAAIADVCVDRPTLFIRAMEIDETSVGLDRLVRRKLEAVTPPYVSDAPDLTGITEAGGLMPLIIIDGLNEARISTKDMRDRWLPDAVRHARGCKIVVSCRPESWEEISAHLPRDLFGSSKAMGPRSGIGEFTETEQRRYLSERFKRVPAFAATLYDPLLLGLAADLQNELPDQPLSRWVLMSQWVAHGCRRAADTGQTSARLIEELLSRVAQTSLQQGSQVISRHDTLAREAGFEGLLREHLVIAEGESFGFRYDLLFEHLAARTIDVRRLTLKDGSWYQDSLKISWSVIFALCERVAQDSAGIELGVLWNHLVAPNPPGNFNLIRCIAALPVTPEREPAAAAVFAAMARHGAYIFQLAASELADARWSRDFAESVLRLIVRASSGYDYRENDLTTPLRFVRAQQLFHSQGFPALVAGLLERGRETFLNSLGKWHHEEEKLGIISGDKTLESSISSWTSCCFVFCSGLLTDAELLRAPAAHRSGTVFGGLALHSPQRLLSLVSQLAASKPLDHRKLAAALTTLYTMGDEVPESVAERFHEAACRLGLHCFDNLQSQVIQNNVVERSAERSEYRESAWQRLIELAVNGVAEGSALTAFLIHKPEEVLALATRYPRGFTSQYGSIKLDLARPPFHGTSAAPSWLIDLRIAILNEEVAAKGYFTRQVCLVLELLCFELAANETSWDRLAEMAAAAISEGPTAAPLLYFAGDQNALLKKDELELSDRVARAFVTASPDVEIVKDLLAKRIKRAARSTVLTYDLRILHELAAAAAKRFGGDLIIEAYVAAMRFISFCGTDRRTAILDACQIDGKDPRLTAEI
ncbi:S1 family peptidase [Sinorhizobium meliloti]|uniref:S1 family peptidase n=1 Tax=Rhizobium meliloti TaxID=382 RepID=UPI00036562B0|nr:serine protease [Sinorhizobium meliloti]